MHINWKRVGRVLAQIVTEIIKFFGRFIRDVWLDLWRGTRPFAIKMIKIALLIGVVYLFIIYEPELATTIFQLGVMLWALYYFILKSMASKKKKKRRR